MTQLYWQIYLNLEREFLELSDTIYINDEQQNVYSMKIADMLIRAVIEIEALSKELYLTKGGAVIPDEEMYFDTVCMAYLDGLWKLDKKVVQVVSPSIYFEKEENRILRPLHKASKRGTSSADWNKAYQAVKHNRVKELAKGSIKHLLHGLAALYVLNLYYRDEKFSGLSNNEKASINTSFGSRLFAVKVHKDKGLRADGVFVKGADFDECVYIEDHDPTSKKVAMDAMTAMNNYINSATVAALTKLIKDRIDRGEKVTEEWLEQEKTNIDKQLFPIKDYKLSKQITDGLGQLKYDVVMNKNQY